MKSTILWALGGLNVLLLALFVGRITRDNTAMAQVRRPADYIMIPGAAQGGTGDIVYVIDATSGQLSAITFDSPNNRLDIMGPIDLARVGETVRPAPTRVPAPRTRG